MASDGIPEEVTRAFWLVAGALAVVTVAAFILLAVVKATG